jgi:hypothetical protein
MHVRAPRFRTHPGQLARGLGALSALLPIALLHACGFVGFEPEAVEVDATLDASADASGDAHVVPEPDATLDGGPPPADTGVQESAVADASFDASLEDAAVDAGPATQVADYCLEVPALPSDPVIDGALDGALNLITLVPQGWRSSDAALLPDHTTAEYAVAWRPEGLYVFVRVVDPNRLPAPADQPSWHGDGVELYVDADGVYSASNLYDSPGTIQIIAAAPSDPLTPAARATRYRDTADVGDWASPRFGTFPTPTGYVLEALVEADALDLATLAFSAGGQLGLDLGINVSVLDSELDAGLALETFRLGQYFLRVGGAQCDGSPYCTVEAFCTPTLID